MGLKFNTIKTADGKTVIEIVFDGNHVATLMDKNEVLTLVQKVDMNIALLSEILNAFVGSSHELTVSRLRFELDF